MVGGSNDSATSARWLDAGRLDRKISSRPCINSGIVRAGLLADLKNQVVQIPRVQLRLHVR